MLKNCNGTYLIAQDCVFFGFLDLIMKKLSLKVGVFMQLFLSMSRNIGHTQEKLQLKIFKFHDALKNFEGISILKNLVSKDV